MRPRRGSGMLLALSMRVAVQMRRFSRPGLALRPLIFRGFRWWMDRLEAGGRADGLTIAGSIAWDGRSEQRGDPA
jgi:hypothetical protein